MIFLSIVISHHQGMYIFSRGKSHDSFCWYVSSMSESKSTQPLALLSRWAFPRLCETPQSLFLNSVAGLRAFPSPILISLLAKHLSCSAIRIIAQWKRRNIYHHKIPLPPHSSHYCPVINLNQIYLILPSFIFCTFALFLEQYILDPVTKKLNDETKTLVLSAKFQAISILLVIA